mgnify:CR=1 FL=1|tara:strand:+ start:139 stop:741 length:603 start_codon:yes stop_codon:yes gene_type:complete
MRKSILTFMILAIAFVSHTQNPIDYPSSFQALYATVFDGDTIGMMEIPETSVIRYKFATTREKNLYNRANRRIEKVFPYYEVALKVIGDLAEVEANSKKRVYNKYKRTTKKELVSKFEKELRGLTMSEGKILVKMINRNSGTTFNAFIKEYLSPIKVWVYNLIAKKYGYDLKEEYISEDIENKYLEMVFKAKHIAISTNE